MPEVSKLLTFKRERENEFWAQIKNKINHRHQWIAQMKNKMNYIRRWIAQIREEVEHKYW